MHAWQQDQHLELRPDDVWLAVLTQFSFYVSGGGDKSRAESLRDCFVAHSGRQALEIIDSKSQSIAEINLATLVKHFIGLVREKLVDPTLADWLLPVFSTTQPNDEVAAASVFFGTVREYFSYSSMLGCGFPSVTLHGERKDWLDLARRISRLAEFDTAPRTDTEGDSSAKSWSQALTVVVDFMIASFERPTAADVQDFWQRACHEDGAESSAEPVKMSGWLTAFCWWRSDGARLKTYSDAELAQIVKLWGPRYVPGPRLKLGDVEFPVINQSDIPPGVVRTNIDFILPGGERVDTTLVAGSWGTQLLDQRGTRVRPFPGWWLVTGDATSTRERREREPEPEQRPRLAILSEEETSLVFVPGSKARARQIQRRSAAALTIAHTTPSS